MANPVITSTTTRWIDSTHIGAKMSWTNGTTGKVWLYLGSTAILSDRTVTNGTEISLTYSGIDQESTYTVLYRVTSGTLLAEKYDTLYGAEPTFSLNPSGGAAFGMKAVAKEFHSAYASIFGDVKINGNLETWDGVQGPLVGNGSVIRPNAPRGCIVPVPYITYDTLGLSAGSTEAQLKAFITAWMKYMVANFTDSNAYALWAGMALPGIRCILLWYPYDTSDKVSALPRYSMGLMVPFGNNSTLWKFGTDNGTVYFNGIFD